MPNIYDRFFSKMVNCSKLVTILAKISVVDVWQGRNQSIDLQSISVGWFLLDRDLCHERGNVH